MAAPALSAQDGRVPESSDLYLLRDAAADERGAIADWRAAEICWMIFLDVAEDEMGTICGNDAAYSGLISPGKMLG